VVPPDPDLECSVCLEVFTDPVSLLCGHTFCRQCAVTWFAEPGKLCPLARCPASANSQPAELPTAYVIKEMVDALRVYCRYGLREDEGCWTPDPEGCLAHLLREEVAAHEAACAHAFEVCSFAGCGVKRRRRDADAHDVAAAVAHARGEREARLAEKARSAALVAAAEARTTVALGARVTLLAVLPDGHRGDASDARIAALGVEMSQRGRVRLKPVAFWAGEALQRSAGPERTLQGVRLANDLTAGMDRVAARRRSAAAFTATAANARALEEEQLRAAAASSEASALAFNAAAISPAMSPGLHAGRASDLENYAFAFAAIVASASFSKNTYAEDLGKAVAAVYRAITDNIAVESAAELVRSVILANAVWQTAQNRAPDAGMQRI